MSSCIQKTQLAFTNKRYPCGLRVNQLSIKVWVYASTVRAELMSLRNVVIGIERWATIFDVRTPLSSQY